MKDNNTNQEHEGSLTILAFVMAAGTILFAYVAISSYLNAHP